MSVHVPLAPRDRAIADVFVLSSLVELEHVLALMREPMTLDDACEARAVLARHVVSLRRAAVRAARELDPNETPAEHLRNALAMLVAMAAPVDVATMNQLRAVRYRVELALSGVERPHVACPQCRTPQLVLAGGAPQSCWWCGHRWTVDA